MLVQEQGSSGVSGTVLFQDDGTNVVVKVSLTGLGTRTSVAIHVHEFGDISSTYSTLENDGLSAGGHYVGAGAAQHGCPPSAQRHAGDMGSWTVTNGAIEETKTLDLLTLTGENSILGRSVVVHDTLDSCTGTAGDAGSRIGFGVIGISSTEPNAAASASVIGDTGLIAVLRSTSNCPFSNGTGCNGLVWFENSDNGILIRASFPGINDGRAHGFHVHSFGNITVADASGAGSHWKIVDSQHMGPGVDGGHTGDLGNVQNYIFGEAWYSYEATAIPSLESLLGRAVILHLDKDHGNGATCDASGTSGKRIAMGVIGIRNTDGTNSVDPLSPFGGGVFDNTFVPESCADTREMDAVALIEGQSGSSVSGTITFSQTATSGLVLVTAYLSGLGPRTEVAIHVHEFGDLTSVSGFNNGSSAGGHYVGAGVTTHGCPGSPDRHAGDMGSWTVVNGMVSQSKLLDLLALHGDNSILGRSVVIHDLVDSCTGSAGDAGGRIGFGVIGTSFSSNNTNLAANSVVGLTNLVAVLRGTVACPSCNGTIWFSQSTAESPILVTGKFSLPDDTAHGLHIHAFGDLSVDTGASAGGHWNPSGDTHNLPPALPRHFGDLGMVQTFRDGFSWYEYPNDLLTSLNDLIGRSVVLHLTKDHGNGVDCDASGSSGSRVAFGVIGIPNTASVPVEIPVDLEIDNNWESTDCTSTGPPPPSSAYLARAVATFTGQSGEVIYGSVEFWEYADHVIVEVNATGLGNRTKVGIHVHEFGDLSSVGMEGKGLSTGLHYIGRGASVHGCPDTSERHQGDMGSWTVTSGVIEETKTLHLLTLRGPFSILGRSVVIHDGAEACDNGTLGDRIAFGVIGIPEDVPEKFPNFGEEVPDSETYIAVLENTESCPGDCAGYVWLKSQNSGILVTAHFPHVVDLGSGGTDSWHGLHVHTYGFLFPPNATGVGGHYNPDGKDHGLPPNEARHQGDLGMVSGYLGQGGWYQYFVSDVSDLHAWVGRAIVLHEDRDHGDGEDCDPSGNSGARIAVGVIGLQNNDPTMTMIADIPEGTTFPESWDAMDCTGSGDGEEGGSGAPWWAWLILSFGLVAIAVAVGLVCYLRGQDKDTDCV